MKKFTNIPFIVLFFVSSTKMLFAQTAPVKAWDKTFGGSSTDYLYAVEQTSDNGFILGGGSMSGISGDKIQASKGSFDYWIIKTDSSGNIVWQKSYGGSNVEIVNSIIQLPGGSYVVAGASDSGISSDKSQPSNGDSDVWILKLDANGTKLWDKSLGGSGSDGNYSMKRTTDGGFIFCGSSDSPVSGDKTQPSRGGIDYWVVKLDSVGNKVWDKTFGGTGTDQPWDVAQTSDGGFIVGGNSYSPANGDKSQASFGDSDYWILKLDANGNKVWDKTFGGSGHDVLWSLCHTTDGGFLIGGSSPSGISGNKGTASKGGSDAWVIKLDANGIKQWEKSLGGGSSDGLRSLQQTPDGGYVLGGDSYSAIGGDKSEAWLGSADYWLVKLNSAGTKIWDKTFGGSAFDQLRAVKPTHDGGYILAGYSDSGINVHKSQASKGTYDFWLIRLGAAQISGTTRNWADFKLIISPNPNNGKFKLEVRDLYKPTVEVTVFDLLGRVVLQREVQIAQNQITEELILPNEKGMYLLQLKAGNQCVSRKIVVQ